MEAAMEQLSSGKRINSAADDAAGLSIATRMEAQIRGLDQAIRNAADGQSLLDTTEGAHQEITNILQRMREIAIQSSNDTNTASDRTSLNAEINQLTAEIDRIGTQTTWNGVAVLDGSFTSKQLQIGAEAGQVLSVSVDSAKSSDIGNYTLNGDATSIGLASAIASSTLTVGGYLGSDTVAVATDASAKAVAISVNAKAGTTGVEASAVTKAKLHSLQAATSMTFTLTGDAAASISATIADISHLGELKDAINAKAGVTGISAAFGDDTSEIVLTHSQGETMAITSFDTGTSDLDLFFDALDRNGAAETHAQNSATLNDTTTAGGEAALATVTGQLSLSSIKSFTVAGDDGDITEGFFETVTNGVTAGGGTSQLSAISALDVSTVAGATDAIRAIDGALDKINAARGDLGAVSNRLDHTMSNLGSIKINIASSQSRIEDADFAKVTGDLTKSQIMSQAATAMLAQANASKQGVLSLLQG